MTNNTSQPTQIPHVVSMNVIELLFILGLIFFFKVFSDYIDIAIIIGKRKITFSTILSIFLLIYSILSILTTGLKYDYVNRTIVNNTANSTYMIENDVIEKDVPISQPTVTAILTGYLVMLIVAQFIQA